MNNKNFKMIKFDGKIWSTDIQNLLKKLIQKEKKFKVMFFWLDLVRLIEKFNWSINLEKIRNLPEVTIFQYDSYDRET